MNENQRASVPDSAGPAGPKASIHVTRAHSFTRVATALLVGAAIAGAGAFLAVLLAAEEPPIRVRPGSIELHLTGGKKWQVKTGYWQIKDGEKPSTQYDLVITTTAPGANCKLESKTNVFKITDSEKDWFIVAIADRRTKVTANDSRKVSLSADKRVLSISTGGYIDEFWDETTHSSICKLGKDEFVGAAVY